MPSLSIIQIQWSVARTVSLAIYAFLLIGCGAATPKLNKLSVDATVLAFGDSLTFGTGASPDESYPVVLEKLITRKVVTAGVPGELSADGMNRLPNVLDEVKPQLLILCHGGNDLLRRANEKQTADNLRQMIRSARERGIAIILIGVPKPGFPVATASFYREIADEFKLPYEESILKTVLTDKALTSDPIHPNSSGYTKIAQALASLMKKSGAV